MMKQKTNDEKALWELAKKFGDNYTYGQTAEKLKKLIENKIKIAVKEKDDEIKKIELNRLEVQYQKYNNKLMDVREIIKRLEKRVEKLKEKINNELRIWQKACPKCKKVLKKFADKIIFEVV